MKRLFILSVLLLTSLEVCAQNRPHTIPVAKQDNGKWLYFNPTSQQYVTASEFRSNASGLLTGDLQRIAKEDEILKATNFQINNGAISWNYTFNCSPEATTQIFDHYQSIANNFQVSDSTLICLIQTPTGGKNGYTLTKANITLNKLPNGYAVILNDIAYSIPSDLCRNRANVKSLQQLAISYDGSIKNEFIQLAPELAYAFQNIFSPKEYSYKQIIRNEILEYYVDGQKWHLYNSENLGLAVSMSTVNDTGKWYKINLIISNYSDKNIDLNPSSDIYGIFDEQLICPIYSFEQFMKNVKRSQTWAKALSAVSYSLDSRSSSASIGQVLLIQSLIMDINNTNRSKAYLKRNTIFPNKAISGSVLIEYFQTQNLEVVINLDDTQFICTLLPDD